MGLISESAALAKVGFSISITPLFAFAIFTNSPAIKPVIPVKSPLNAFIVASTFASLILGFAGSLAASSLSGFGLTAGDCASDDDLTVFLIGLDTDESSGGDTISGFLGTTVSFLGSGISTFCTALSGPLPRTRLSNNF